jgi:hypothetical protein
MDEWIAAYLGIAPLNYRICNDEIHADYLRSIVES